MLKNCVLLVIIMLKVISVNELYKLTGINQKEKTAVSDVKDFGVENAKTVRDFHKSFPEYSVTPLAELEALARSIGVKNIYIKDESYRFGLNAFKVLGGSFAIGSFIARKLGCEISELPFERLVSDEIKEKIGEITFVTATDGNHGRGVAWTANRLKQKSVVFMPRGTSKERLDNILSLGSDASITDMLYDDAVRHSEKCAEKFGWVVVQDTAWDGYYEIPKNIMQGYTTMALEAYEQLGKIKPTHIFLQAGVGSMAGAVCAFFTDAYGDENRPVITILEPNGADCVYNTALHNDGRLYATDGDMNSIMAGLCCGEVCPIAWDVLKDHADFFVTAPDSAAETGMRVLGKPLGDDKTVISGESGASTLGYIYEVMTDPELADIKNRLGLDENSVILCFSTEGDTDKENYAKVLAAAELIK